MNEASYVVTDVGRLVSGSLYQPFTKDRQGNLIVNKKGEPTPKFYFALAIPKVTQDWRETNWGRVILATAMASFPGGAYQRPTFAWKIVDGDSTVPNNNDTVPANCAGYTGCWVLNLSTYIAFRIFDATGDKELIEKDYIKPGDFIEAYLHILGNSNQQNPGVYLNPKIVSFQAYGPRITLAQDVDPRTLGFGKKPLPAGASPTPLSTGRLGVSAPPPLPPLNVPAAPYAAILTPGRPVPVPAPPATVTRRMLPASYGRTYEDYKAGNWTDEQLIEYGYMSVE